MQDVVMMIFITKLALYRFINHKDGDLYLEYT